MIVILILIPINAWLWVLYYLHQQSKEVNPLKVYKEEVALRVAIVGEKWGVREGQRIVYPFPLKTQVTLLGVQPPVGKGVPVLFVNISWITAPEVFDLAIQEALRTSPSLHIVLLSHPVGRPPYTEHYRNLKEMLNHFRHNPRISILVGDWVNRAFGGEFGILAFICDGNGIVKAVEHYPPLKIAGSREQEAADWRPKLHQAVRRALEKFFEEQSGKAGEGR